ncbi:MAG: YfcC family protein [Alphaproteobacteria bacterium]|nr:YfcC family protein [Alphaproteobacteria bacterium]
MTKKRIPHAFTIIFALIIIVAIFTWILPAGKFETRFDEAAGREVVVAGTYKTVDSNPQGIQSVLTSFSKGIIEAAEVIAFVLIVGGSYGIIIKTGAIEAGLNQAIRKFGSKDKLVIPILMILFSIGGTTTGMWEETLPFFMITIPLMVALGFDPIVGIAVIILGAGIGTLGSTVNPFATGIASAIAGINISEGFYLRVLLYVVSVILACGYVLWYALRIKKDPTKSIVYYAREDHLKAFAEGGSFGKNNADSTFSAAHKIILVLLFAAIIFMVFAIIKLDWWMSEITMLFIALAVISGLIAKMDNNTFWDSFIDGSKDLLSAALVIGLSRAIVVVANEGMILDTILNGAANFLGGLSRIWFVILNEFVQIAIAFLVPSSSGHAALTMPIMAPLADLFDVPRSVIVILYQGASGVVNLITPTAGVLMAAIAMARITWVDWLKFVYPLLIILVAVVIIIAVMGL